MDKMISQREVERQYNKMLESESIKGDVDLNKVNVYSCKCSNRFKTIDIDKGVTPFMKACKCGSMATSSFYKDIAPELVPIGEWFRPSLKETMKYRSKFPEMLDHILNGGLDYREISKKS